MRREGFEGEGNGKGNRDDDGQMVGRRDEGRGGKWTSKWAGEGREPERERRKTKGKVIGQRWRLGSRKRTLGRRRRLKGRRSPKSGR